MTQMTQSDRNTVRVCVTVMFTVAVIAFLIVHMALDHAVAQDKLDLQRRQIQVDMRQLEAELR